jgi:hypothetical protein
LQQFVLEVIWIQLSLLTAVHGQLLFCITLTLLLPPASVKAWFVEESVGGGFEPEFETDSMLLLGTGSGVGDSTLAVLVMVDPSGSEQLTNALTVAVTVENGAIIPILKVTALPLPLHPEPTFELQELKLTKGDSSSVIVTPKAGSGPSLFTVMVYWIKLLGVSVPDGPVRSSLKSDVRLGVASSLVTNPSLEKLPKVVWKAPGVVGKLVELVVPVTYALPDEFTVIPNPWSELLPPRYVEYPNPVPVAVNFVTYASELKPDIVWNVPGVVGKFLELVAPVTYAFLDASTAILLLVSKSSPPRYVQ